MLSNKEKEYVRYAIWGATALGTIYIYKSLNLIDIVNPSKQSENIVQILRELDYDMKVKCEFYNEQPSILDEKAANNVVELARLYYYGYPVMYNEDNKVLSGSIFANIMKQAIDPNNTSLPQKIPSGKFDSFMREEYNKYKNSILIANQNGIKVRIPHQPLLTNLPLVISLFQSRGYGKFINENLVLYRLISFQETLRQLTDENKTIVNGINIGTGKTVVEEPPPSDAIVVPTTGPYAGIKIPVSETAYI